MYIVEGNIGVGKSTFLTLIEKTFPHMPVIPEPKESWLNETENATLLERFYQDTPRWAYTLETLTMFRRVHDYTKVHHVDTPHVMERSIYSGHYCFALNDYEHGHLSPIEWKIYLEWLTFLVEERCNPPQGFIYLRATPDTCATRIKKRGRHAETGITHDYLEQIHHKHEDFLIKKHGIFAQLKDVPVLVLDCDTEFATTSRWDEFATKIADFVKS